VSLRLPKGRPCHGSVRRGDVPLLS
jgi:hypothetical protein